MLYTGEMTYELTVPTDDANEMYIACGSDSFECAYVFIDTRMDHIQAGFRMPLATAEEFLDNLTKAVADARAEQSLIDTEI